jgi:hypothetical protein
VARAIEYPPEDTRAYFRGRCLRKYPDAVATASWDSVIFDIPGGESPRWNHCTAQSAHRPRFRSRPSHRKDRLPSRPGALRHDQRSTRKGNHENRTTVRYQCRMTGLGEARAGEHSVETAGRFPRITEVWA